MYTNRIPETNVSADRPTEGIAPEWASTGLNVGPRIITMPEGRAEDLRRNVEEAVAHIYNMMPLFDLIDRYIAGDHDNPYVERNRDGEHNDRLKRSVTNFMGLAVRTLVQELYIDGFGLSDETEADKEAWDRWQRMQMDFKQRPMFDGSTRYGYSYLECRSQKGKREELKAIVHSPRWSAGLFEDPLDTIPFCFVALDDYSLGEYKHGTARYSQVNEQKGWVFDGKQRHRFILGGSTGGPEKRSFRILASEPHGCSSVPVVRVSFRVDINGKPVGVIEPLKAQQDKINQIAFDLLSAQASSAHITHWASGLKTPIKMSAVYDETGNVVGSEPVRNPDTGQPVADQPHMAPGSFVTNGNPDVKFGSFETTNLAGYHSSLELSVQHLSAMAQMPPHFILGQIANMSAEALDAARDSLNGLLKECKGSMGEALEQFAVMAAEIDGQPMKDAHKLECKWREMSERSLSNIADGIIKLGGAAQLAPDSYLMMWPDMSETMQEKLREQRENHRNEELKYGFAEEMGAMNEMGQAGQGFGGSQAPNQAQPNAGASAKTVVPGKQKAGKAKSGSGR